MSLFPRNFDEPEMGDYAAAAANELRLDRDRLRQENVALRKLVVGCKRHPAYRAHVPPLTDCKTCKEMWEVTAEVSHWDEKDQ